MGFFRTFLLSINTPVLGGRQEYFLIDLLRGLASIAILLVHYKHFFQGVDSSELTANAIQHVDGFSYWAPVYYWGSNAVQLFWLISGFIFLHVYGSRQQETWKGFLVNRMARLYPLHILTLMVVMLLQAYSVYMYGGPNIYSNNDAFHFFLNIFFASEWGFQNGRSFNGPIWSVSVEIFSYLIFFAVLRYFKLSFLSILSCWVAACFLYYFSPSAIVLCLIYFFFGCFTYACLKCIDRFSFFSKFTLLLLSFVTFVSAAYFLSSIPRVFVYLPIFGSLVSILAVLEGKININRISYLAWIGAVSYGNYLWHSPLQMIFLVVISAGLINPSIIYSAYFLPLYVATVCGFSYLSFKFFERPAQKMIKSIFKN